MSASGVPAGPTSDAVTRAEALRALAHLGDARAAGPLLAALADTEVDDETGEVAGLLEEAREALGRTGE